VTLCDAGPLYALVNKHDAHSARCRALLQKLSFPLITTWPCFTEAMYFAYDAGGWFLQKALWQLIRRGDLRLHTANDEEAERMQTLMEQYQDTPMDFADASLVAAAETLGIARVFTTDSHFYAYQRHGKQPFEVVP